MEKLVKYSALLYAFLLFIGYSYNDSYYYLFGIDIFSFLDVSEILILFLSNFNFLVVLLLLIVVMYIVPFVFLSRINYKPVLNFVNASEKRKGAYIYINLFVSIGVVIYCAVRITLVVINGNIVHGFTMICIGTILIFAVIYYNLLKIFENRNINKPLLSIIVVTILICLLNFMTAIFQYKKVKSRIGETIFSFNYESKNYKSSDSLVFIGSSSKYIFIRNVKKETNYIYEKENIRNLELTRKKDDTNFN